MNQQSIGRRLSVANLIAQLGLMLMLGLAIFGVHRATDKSVRDELQATTDVAGEMIEHFYELETSGAMTHEQAQVSALAALKALRYSGKEYFWVNDMHPRMLMHPVKPELEGKDLSDMKDPSGLPLFKRMVDIVKTQKQGFLRYSWPKPGKDAPQPKMSFVRGFAPWGWVYGTGLYLDDINAAFWRQAGLLIALALGLNALPYWIVRRTVRGVVEPVDALTQRMQLLAEGDHATAIPGVERGDELGRMAQTLGVFRDTAIAKKKADEDQAFVVNSLSACLAGASQGDLTREITVAFPASYEQLRSDYNAAMGSLRELVGAIGVSTEILRTGSGEIAHASEDLARRTEADAASLEETSAALTQMNESVRGAVQLVSETVDEMGVARGIVEQAREAALSSVAVMGRVSESAKGIDNVIEGLDKIAFQTRVLAMNAAVEAGRAGEAGKGFAVVADLVSALAMRSEEEAQRAREQLTTTQDDIVAAVDAVTKVDGALADINDGVSEVHTLLASMAEDNQRQSIAVSEINGAISTMDQSTQQNAAMVEETSAAARNLLTEVRTLASNAARFEIGRDHPNPETARKQRATNQTAAYSAPAAERRDYVSPVAALPMNGQANGHANGHAAGDWADF